MHHQMESCRKNIKSLDTGGSSLDLARLLRISNKHAEAGTALLALAENLAIVPHAGIGVASVGEDRVLVALRIPPATDASHDFGDGLVVRGGWRRV